MIITFLGTGEACDPHRRNTSILVEHNNLKVMLDCGFSSFQAYLQQEDTAALDTFWLSHLHGDHFFGFPQLILYFFMHGRTRPLTILSGKDCTKRLFDAVELAYPGLLDKLEYPLNFIQVSPEKPLQHLGFTWQSVPVLHSQDAFAVRISTDDCSLFYSGDGKMTDESKNLMTGCDFVIHEAHSMHPNPLSHSSIVECLETAEDKALAFMALVHINRETWEQLEEGKLTLPQSKITQIILPKDGDALSVP